jgi:hypothetical protein
MGLRLQRLLPALFVAALVPGQPAAEMQVLAGLVPRRTPVSPGMGRG